MAGASFLRYGAGVIRAAFFLLLLLPGAALAQVAVNHGALDQLTPSAPAPATAATPPPAADKRPAARHAAPAWAPRIPPAASAPARAVKPRPRPVSVAPAPPPAAVLPPVAEAPKPASVPPPPPVPIVADAVGEFMPLQGGVRITFGPTKADLNQTTANALIEIAREVRADPTVDLSVLAYAAGLPDDPSTARRLSLSRALAARAVLISEGIASTRIYVRALGTAPGEGPPDRVDLVRAGLPAPGAKP